MDGLGMDNAGASCAPQARDDLEASFKAAMRHLVSGVSVVTVDTRGEQGGLTATSVTSLSTDPPSLIVCVKQSASGMRLLRQAEHFGVSVLAPAHTAVADRFAGRDGSAGANRFADAAWITGPRRPPVLADALASFECQLEEIIDRFSHAIVIGRVLRTRICHADHALVYWRGAYGRVGTSRTSV